MKIKSGFEMREVCGEKIVLAQGIENLDFCKLISLNESAAYLWERIGDRPFDAALLAGYLQEEYEVSAERAVADAEALIAEWRGQGLLED